MSFGNCGPLPPIFFPFWLREWFYYVIGKTAMSLSLSPQKSKGQEWSPLPLESKEWAKANGFWKDRRESGHQFCPRAPEKHVLQHHCCQIRTASVFYQKVIQWTVSMGKMLLGELSVSRYSPLKNGHKLLILQTSEGWGSRTWQCLVREHAVVEPCFGTCWPWIKSWLCS